MSDHRVEKSYMMMHLLPKSPLRFCYGTMGKTELTDGAHGARSYRPVEYARVVELASSQGRLVENSAYSTIIRHSFLKNKQLTSK